MAKQGFVRRTFDIPEPLDSRLDVYVQRFNLAKTKEGKQKEKITRQQLVAQAVDELLKSVGG